MTLIAATGIAMSATAFATPSQMKMMTSFDAVPDKETTQKVYDTFDLRRSTEAFLAALPIASMVAMGAGIRSFGPVNTTAILFENQMDSKSLWLTANTVSI